MNGTPLNVHRIRELVTEYIQDPVRYLQELMEEIHRDPPSRVEKKLALINPDCWMNIPQISSWKEKNNITNKRKTVQEMFGKNGWTRHEPGNCECGQTQTQCGANSNDDLVMDHWYPVSDGGPFWGSNLKMLAPYCNRTKSSDFGNFVGDADVAPWIDHTLLMLFNDFVSKNMY